MVGATVVSILGGDWLAGCGKKSDDSLQQIKDKKVLTMGTSADYAPFEFTIMKNGKKEYVGYDIMVAQKIADSLGVKLKVQNMEFSSIISELQDHKVDIALAGMNVTPQRKKAVDFSKPYYTEQESLLVKKPTPISTTRSPTRRALPSGFNNHPPRKRSLRPKPRRSWFPKA